MLDLPSWLDDLVPLRDPTGLPRVLTRADAHRLGVTDTVIKARVCAGSWRRLTAGIYLTVPDARPSDHLLAAGLHGGPRAVVSGRAALLAHGLKVGRPDTELVLVPPDVRVRSSGRVRVRRTDRVPTPEHRFGVPIAPVARAVADAVVGHGTLDDARALVALAVQRGSTAIDDLAAELAAGPHRGSAHLRLALDEIRDGARSAPEARAATALRRGGITGFEQNVEVYAHGRRFVADFLWRALRAILEVDGRDYHFDAREWMATNRRDAQLESAGYSVIHVTPSDLKDEADFVGRVRLWLAGRARRTVLPS